MDPDPTSNLSNTNRTIYDSDDENWAEIRSKNVPKLSKPKVAKTPKKRRRKAAPTISRPALPRVPTHAIRFGVPFNTNFSEEFRKSIGMIWNKATQRCCILGMQTGYLEIWYQRICNNNRPTISMGNRENNRCTLTAILLSPYIHFGSN
ncbi:hypothetical protein H5410_048504 [Solanum commersonii]|uniref:Uncharacterized protein n=1 Tax=Solanum commersonii TaxID=4109 RepID=A0A9J5XLX2_SOLCO|nr:hypothetical protein H5410_048504 [Solanum commersonii]